MNVGQKIKKYRKKLGMTQHELAQKANISRSYLGDVENGRYNPSLNMLESLAEVLEVSVDSLLAKSIGSIIDDRLEELNLTMEDLADQTKLPITYLNSLDNIDPDPSDYNKVLFIARALKMPPGILRNALARQEVPAYDGPTSTPKEDFDDLYNKDGKLANEVKAIEDGIGKAKKLAPTLDTIPTEFIDPEEARAYINMHQIFGSDGLDADNLSDDEVLEFANELLRQMHMISYKYKK